MNTKKYVIASLAAAVWLLLYGFVMNVIVLAGFFAKHTAPGIMRPEAEQVMGAIIASCLLQGFALGMIFVKGYEGKGLGEGARFGLLIAWFVGALYLLFYAIQPWQLNTTVVSIVNDGMMYVGAGVVLAALYRR